MIYILIKPDDSIDRNEANKKVLRSISGVILNCYFGLKVFHDGIVIPSTDFQRWPIINAWNAKYQMLVDASIIKIEGVDTTAPIHEMIWIMYEELMEQYQLGDHISLYSAIGGTNFYKNKKMELGVLTLKNWLNGFDKNPTCLTIIFDHIDVFDTKELYSELEEYPILKINKYVIWKGSLQISKQFNPALDELLSQGGVSKTLTAALKMEFKIARPIGTYNVNTPCILCARVPPIIAFQIDEDVYCYNCCKKPGKKSIKSYYLTTDRSEEYLLTITEKKQDIVRALMDNCIYVPGMYVIGNKYTVIDESRLPYITNLPADNNGEILPVIVKI